MKKIIDTIALYWAYPSTKQAITVIIGFFGYQVAPEFQEQIVLAVGSILTALQLFFSDADVVRKKK